MTCRVPFRRILFPALAIGLLPMLPGCAANVSGPATFQSMGGPATQVFVPVQSFDERRFLTVIRQRYDFSCGSAALATLLHYHYEDPQTEEGIFLGMWRDGDQAQIRRLGFSLLDMKRYLAARGFGSDGFKITIEQLEKAGVPGIALININGYKHFVVVKGVRDGQVLIGDPSVGLRRMSAKAFVKVWNGVYFIRNDALPQGRSTFSTPLQWAKLPVGRIDQTALPLSASQLSLMVPAYGEY